MQSIDWNAVLRFVWPIVREGLVALLVAILALLGYDKVVPSRFVRMPPEERDGFMAGVSHGLGPQDRSAMSGGVGLGECGPFGGTRKPRRRPR